MTQRRSADGFQVNQDMAFQHRDWTAQRIGWVVMMLTVIGALAGAFGHGPLGNADIGRVGGLRLEYERLTRHGSDSFLRVGLPAMEGAREARIWLDREFADRLRVEAITPEPESAEISAHRVTYTFKLGPEPGPSLVTFDITPMALWATNATLGLDGGDTLTFSQFVYP